MNIDRDLNVIKINNLGVPSVPNEFLVAVHKGIEAGFNDFQLDFSEVKAVFPNAANPIAGIIHYHRANGINFTRKDHNGIVEKIGLLEPKQIPSSAQPGDIFPLNQIWIFETSQELYTLVDSYVIELSKTDQFEDGVLNSISWCLNEITENVLNHSGASVGFIMGQTHRASKHVAFSIYDYGMGLYNSLKDSKHKPKDTRESILLAIREGVTRDPSAGAGNGLFGMHEVVRLNKGSISILTGNTHYYFANDSTSFKDKQIYLSPHNQALSIDFQLDYKNKVSLSDIFKFKGNAYKFINLRIENLENDRGEIEYPLHDHKAGFGSRKSGAMVRNDVMNIHKESNQTIVLNFTGISIISSSFADELIGKLMVEYGIYKFNNLFRLKGLNDLNQAIIQRSVIQRLSSSLNDNS